MDRRAVLASAVGGAAGGAAEGRRATARPPGGPRASGGAAGLVAAPRASPAFVEAADGTPLFVRDWPPRAGATDPGGAAGPVVFLASWSLPSDMWAYQMLALGEAGLRCVAHDRRGHGRSGDPGRGYDFDTLADDLAAVMDALDLRGATLVGFSMGPGEIARYLTRHGAGRVARVAFLGTTTPYLPRAADNPGGVDPAAFEALRARWLMRDFPGWVDANMVPFVTPDTPEATRNWVRDMALRTSPRAILDLNRAVTTEDFRADLPRLRVPTLVLHGARDESCPPDLTARPTAALVPGARLLVYEDAPHGLFLTHAGRLNADLLAFATGRE